MKTINSHNSAKWISNSDMQFTLHADVLLEL